MWCRFRLSEEPRTSNGKQCFLIIFLFFQIPVTSLAASDQSLALEIRRQLYEQTKNQTAEDIYHAAMLTRIAPLPLMHWLTKIPMQGKTGSFYFSCLKESSFTRSSFFGVEVDNLLHTPHIPIPPGIGVTMNLFKQKLNLTLAFAEGLLTLSEENRLIESLRRMFS